MISGLIGWGEVSVGLVATLGFFLRHYFTKTMSKIEKLDDSIHEVSKAIVALEVKIEGIQGIKDDLKVVTEKNCEAAVRISDLRKDVNVAHQTIREIKKGLQ